MKTNSLEPLVPLQKAAEFCPAPIRKRQLCRYAVSESSRPSLITIVIGSWIFTSKAVVDLFVKACNGDLASC